jgi:chemotaxis response regulator CheB
MTVVGEAGNGREAVDLWKQRRPDVTLLDLRHARAGWSGRHQRNPWRR